jgi:hypothetical protein
MKIPENILNTLTDEQKERELKPPDPLKNSSQSQRNPAWN